MHKVVHALALAGAAFSLGGCANSVLTVEQPYVGNQQYAYAEIQAADSSVEIDDDNRDYTARKLNEAIFGGAKPIFVEGSGLTLRWRYVGFNEGSRFGRYMTAGIAGASKVVLEVEFVDQSGEVVSTVRGEGSVSGGIGGGSNKSGIDKAVQKIAEYAESKFSASTN